MLPAGNRPLHVFLSAGEASGDLHGAELVRSLRGLQPQMRITCLGGPRLRAAGAEVLVDNRDIAVVGLFEVVRHLRTIHAAWNTIRSHLASERPHVVVLIDFPDFNFMLARLAKRLGIKVFYYISPQVWAWRRGRVRTIKRYVHEMATILPFETEFYAHSGMTVHYVGHPLMDLLERAPSEEDARARYRPGGVQRVVGLLPGSRRSEVRTLLPILLDSAELIAHHLPSTAFVLPVAPSLDIDSIRQEVRERRLPIRVISGDTYGAIRASDLVITASGTVTLEAAILGTPMLITYRVSNLSYYAGRHLIKVAWVGLPNLIAGRMVAPELLQHDARPDVIARTALRYLGSPERLRELRLGLEGIVDRLGEPGVAGRVARLVLATCAACPAKQHNGARLDGSALQTPAASDPSTDQAAPAITKDRTVVCHPRGGPRFFHALNLLALPAYPFIGLYYVVQSTLKGKYRMSRRARLGLDLPRLEQGVPRLWIHALSVGETSSVVPLVQALNRLWPDAEVVFSTATETGQLTARRLLSQVVKRLFYMPHDFPWVMERLVRSVAPDLFVLVETDVWPNLLRSLKHHGVPSVLVNARLSPTSFERLHAVRSLVKPLFSLLDAIVVQSEQDRERYVALGVEAGRVRAMGNLKFDAISPDGPESKVDSFRTDLGVSSGRAVWVAGSTHDAEEELLLTIHRNLLRSHPGLLLILAPRDFRRGEEIRELCRRGSMTFGMRSRRDIAEGKTCYILDSLGELRHVYGLADAVFIGGSLVPFGGHNPLEAVAHGKPVFWGPHLFNFREIERSLMESGCGVRIDSPDELERVVSRVLSDSSYRNQIQGIAQEFLQRHQGAAARVAGFLRSLSHNEARP